MHPWDSGHLLCCLNRLQHMLSSLTTYLLSTRCMMGTKKEWPLLCNHSRRRHSVIIMHQTKMVPMGLCGDGLLSPSLLKSLKKCNCFCRGLPLFCGNHHRMAENSLPVGSKILHSPWSLKSPDFLGCLGPTEWEAFGWACQNLPLMSLA